jgi:heptosyltransferase III
VAEIERILIFRLASMGDTVVSLPCFHAIRRRYPTAQIALLTARIPDASAIPAATLLEGTGLVNHYISYPESTRDWQKLREIKKEIRAFDPSLLIYLAAPRGSRNTYRDYLFFRWCGVRRFTGVPFTRDLRECRPPEPGSHLWESEAHRLARCIPHLTTDVACEQDWTLCLSDRELSTALQLLRPNTKCLGLAPGARHAAKDWGIENWQTVLAGIANPALTLVLIGAATDRDRSDRMATGWPGPVINLCGETSPRMSAAVIKHLDLLVCHDGGPMHLAAAIGTRCVAVFGNVNPPGQWFPFGADHKVFHPGLHGTIQPSKVIDAVQDALAATVEPMFGDAM